MFLYGGGGSITKKSGHVFCGECSCEKSPLPRAVLGYYYVFNLLYLCVFSYNCLDDAFYN